MDRLRVGSSFGLDWIGISGREQKSVDKLEATNMRFVTEFSLHSLPHTHTHTRTFVARQRRHRHHRMCSAVWQDRQYVREWFSGFLSCSTQTLPVCVCIAAIRTTCYGNSLKHWTEWNWFLCTHICQRISVREFHSRPFSLQLHRVQWLSVWQIEYCISSTLYRIINQSQSIGCRVCCCCWLKLLSNATR